MIKRFMVRIILEFEDIFKNLLYNSYIYSKDFFEPSVFKPNRKTNAKFVKELIDTATYRPALLNAPYYFITNYCFNELLRL